MIFCAALLIICLCLLLIFTLHKIDVLIEKSYQKLPAENNLERMARTAE